MFKVGDKGKTRDGRDYEVVRVSREFGDMGRVWVFAAIDGTTFAFRDDGRISPFEEKGYDLMPPTDGISDPTPPREGIFSKACRCTPAHLVETVCIDDAKKPVPDRWTINMCLHPNGTLWVAGQDYTPYNPDYPALMRLFARVSSKR